MTIDVKLPPIGCSVLLLPCSHFIVGRSALEASVQDADEPVGQWRKAAYARFLWLA